ncbi:MAG: DUF169 domain-containing protein [Deltaproteobacteria bacterium]|nr:MAG: DUF169 domain-containing protein [Deltaproteobacteria bacterium]
MTLTKKDFAILGKFEFDRSPVCVKYTYKRPDHLSRLGENTTLCIMLKKAQEGNAFYADKNNITCGDALLGMENHSPVSLSGELASAIKVFEEPRSGRRLYPQIPKIEKGLINYISFSPLNKFSFDPDVLIIFTNNTDQTQILLRATSYRTAKVWTSKFTNVLGCAWIYVYPYLSGEVNYGMTGLSHGMGRRKLFPDGLQFVSIPYLIMPSVLQALRDMPWELPSFKPDGEEFFNRTRNKLAEELPKHKVV